MIDPEKDTTPDDTKDGVEQITVHSPLVKAFADIREELNVISWANRSTHKSMAVLSDDGYCTFDLFKGGHGRTTIMYQTDFHHVESVIDHLRELFEVVDDGE